MHAAKSISLVLGSGGARGMAHIGVIQVLEERGFTIRSISGSSVGALVGVASAQLPVLPVSAVILFLKIIPFMVCFHILLRN